MITYHRATSMTELQQILALQKKNLPIAISEETQISEGYVTIDHDFDMLHRMNEACPHIIAKEGEKLVGYTLCMHPKFGDEIQVLLPMFKEIREVIKDHSNAHGLTKANYIVMGQVCIDKDYRRQGVFRKLYETMLKVIQPQFRHIITEVDTKNVRSLEAHYGIGFKLLSRYSSDGRIWDLISLS